MPSDPKSIRKLTAKQLRFMLEYLVDLNATQAAIRAGYSQKTAKEQGSRLLTKVHQFMPQYLGPILQGTALKAEQVVQGLSLLASSDIGDYMKWDSKKKLTLKDMSELTPQQRYCIESVEEKSHNGEPRSNSTWRKNNRPWIRSRSITTSSSGRRHRKGYS